MAAVWLPASVIGPSGTMEKSFTSVVAEDGDVSPTPDVGSLGLHRGELALLLSKKDVTALSTLYKNILVGQFPLSRPPMDIIRKFFISLGLKGSCLVGLLDSNHVLIRPNLEEDYTRLFVRRTWFIQNSPMMISKWIST